MRGTSGIASSSLTSTVAEPGLVDTPRVRRLSSPGSWRGLLPVSDSTGNPRSCQRRTVPLVRAGGRAPQGIVPTPRLEQARQEHLFPSFQKSTRSEEHTSELQSLAYLVCRLLLEKKKKSLRCYMAHQQ